jgi:hypothetical protein
MLRQFAIIFFAPVAFAAACATQRGEPDRYWEKLAGRAGAGDFDFANTRCGASPSAVSEQAYMDCMCRAGRRVASRRPASISARSG